MVIVEDHTVTVKCRTAIKGLFLYFSLCISVILDSLSCSYSLTSTSFLTNYLLSVHLSLINSRSDKKVLSFKPSTHVLIFWQLLMHRKFGYNDTTNRYWYLDTWETSVIVIFVKMRIRDNQIETRKILQTPIK
jgi:hypothetical protein